jgi:hypothetical protein
MGDCGAFSADIPRRESDSRRPPHLLIISFYSRIFLYNSFIKYDNMKSLGSIDPTRIEAYNLSILTRYELARAKTKGASCNDAAYYVLGVFKI